MKEDEIKKLLIEQLRKTPIVQLACERTGVARSTYYRWRKNSSKFSKMTNEAIMDGVFFINDLAETQIISAIKDRNIPATTFWLRKRHKSYSDKLEVTNKEYPEKLDKKQKALLHEALSLVPKKITIFRKVNEKNETRE